MKPPILLVVSPFVVVLGLSACDGGSEAEVAVLSEELSATQAELDAALSENERLRTELEAMPADASPDAAADQTAGGDPMAGGDSMAPAVREAVRGELEAMTEKLTVALNDLSALEAQSEDGELRKVRANLEEAVGSARTLLTVVGGSQTPPAGQGEAESPAGATGEAPPEVLEEAPQGLQDPAQQ